MKRRRLLLCIGLAVATFGTILWARDAASDSRTASPDEVLSDALAREAAQLRTQGPSGLTTALLRRPALEQMPTAKRAAATREWRALVDAVAGQRDAWASLLYWYTDLDAAKVAAEAAGKPILSLRLLGRLTDEHSCANSRYFRKTLYPNGDVGRFLRENFILHWESVRPVPTVTINFGDGRTLKRTITGNSVHYVLDCHGRLVDALPGLYAPRQFLAALRPAWEVAVRTGNLDDPIRQGELSLYHEREYLNIESRLKHDLQRLGAPVEKAAGWHPLLYAATLSSADESTLRPISSELRLNRQPRSTLPLPDRDLRIWELLSHLHQEDVQQDVDTLLVIAPGTRPVQRANRLAMPKVRTESLVVANVQLDEFSADRALDYVYNEYALRYKIHWQLRNSELHKLPLADFTRWCYAEVFLSPLDDPWYGLKSNAYDGYDMPPADQTAQIAR